MQFAVQQSFALLQKAAGKGVAHERGAQGDQRADFGLLRSAKSLDAVDLTCRLKFGLSISPIKHPADHST